MTSENSYANGITEEMDEATSMNNGVSEVRNRRPSVKKLSSMDSAEIPRARRVKPRPSRPREKVMQQINKTRRSGAESVNGKNSNVPIKEEKCLPNNSRQRRLRENQKIEENEQPVSNEFSPLSELPSGSSHATVDPITMDEEMPLSFCTNKRSANDVTTFENDENSTEPELPKPPSIVPDVNAEVNSPQRQGSPESEDFDFSLHLSSESEAGGDSGNEGSGRNKKNGECDTNRSTPTLATLQLPILKKHLEKSDDTGEVYVIETIVFGKTTIVIGLNIRAGTSIDQIQNFVEFNLMAYSTKASMFNVVKNFQYDKCPIIMGGDFNIDFKTFRGRKFIAFLRNTFGVEMNHDPMIAMNRNNNDVDAVFIRNVRVNMPTDNEYFALF